MEVIISIGLIVAITVISIIIMVIIDIVRQFVWSDGLIYTITAIAIILGLGILAQIVFTIAKNDTYIKQYSYELKKIENKEYEFDNASGKFVSIFLISYGSYHSSTEYVEYYVLWQETSRGLEKVKLENKNVYIIENNEETPRIECFKKKYNEDDYYYQIYVPENSIISNYKLD